MAKKRCPNCQFDIENQDLEESPHCPGCGANLKAKKYTRSDDPSELQQRMKKLEEDNDTLKKDNDSIKKKLQEKEDEDADSRKRTRRSLFGS